MPRTILTRLMPALVALAVLASAAAAQNLRVAFRGNTVVPARDLAAALDEAGIRAYAKNVGPAIGRTLTAYYEGRGWFNIAVDSIAIVAAPDSARFDATVFLTENCPFVVDSVRFRGAAALSVAQLRDAATTRPGDPLSPRALQRDAMQMLALYERAGFPFAAVTIDRIDMNQRGDTALADVEFGISEGDRVVISEITARGNAITATDVIVRELRLARDEQWTPETADHYRRRLERMNFFASVDEPLLYNRNGRYGMLVRVKEGNTNSFDGIIGFQPGRTAAEPGTLTGLVNLSFRNLFGSGRRFDARWERASSALTELELRYLEPWVLGYPVNAQGGFFQRFLDSTYVRRAFDLKLTLLASENIQVSAAGQAVRVIPSASGANAVSGSAAYNAGLELAIDTRDNPFNPFRGVIFRNSYMGGWKRTDAGPLQPASSDLVQRIEIDAALYREALPNTVAALALHARELRGAHLDVSDLFRLGGAATLRGYREEQFAGTRLVWGNLEFRYSLGRKSYAFVFFDAGYIFLAEDASINRTGLDVFRNGYGVGGRIETPIGVLAVSYALGAGDTFTTAKIHFGLVNDF